MSFSLPCSSASLPVALLVALSSQEGFRVPEIGLEFDVPGDEWEQRDSVSTPGGGTRLEFRRDGFSVDLHWWAIDPGRDLDALCDSELAQVGTRGTIEEAGRGERTVSGQDSRFVRYHFTASGDEADEVGDQEVLRDATYFHTGEWLGRLCVEAPATDADEFQRLVAHAPTLLRLRDPDAARGPLDFGSPFPGRVLTVVRGSSDSERALRYLEALPGAARGNDGNPIVLIVGDRLDEPARDFLRKYRPSSIRWVGPPLAELPQAVPAEDAWPRGGTVVISSLRWGDAVQAAVLATRRGWPLLFADSELAQRLTTLAPERCYLVGDIGDAIAGASGVFARATVETLDGPADVARIAGGANYLAVCNIAEGASPECAAFAAALAAARSGVVLPIEMSMTTHAIPLQPTDAVPDSWVGDGGERGALVGEFEAVGMQWTAAAVRIADVTVGAGSAARYGRLRLDGDGNGRLRADEELRVGNLLAFGDRRFHVRYRYAHPFVGYLRSELLLDEFDPQELRARILECCAELETVEFLALVGTPDLVPFYYEEATSYFEAYDIKQELATDAPYADLDGDDDLELAVGRMPIDELAMGSVVLATTLSYPLEGEWTTRATLIQPGFHELEGSLPWVLPNAEALIRGIEGDLRASGVDTLGFYRDDVDLDRVVDSMASSAWIAYFNHSGPGTWGIHPGSSIVTRRVSGPNRRAIPRLEGSPIVFGGGCSSAALDVGQPLSSTFPGRFFELGAVAYLGNTRVASAWSEHLTQTFFARLAAGNATLGQAYRDGRNFLAHLLHGGHATWQIELGIEPGVDEFLWGQHRILNLFGDPALQPVLPDGAQEQVAIEWLATVDPERWQLSVSTNATLRRDPLLMMPGTGQGEPREFHLPRVPGLTAAQVPHEFVGEGLAPVRTNLELPPAVWVDVELPAPAGDVEWSVADGPSWADRGFSLHRGARGELRLQTFVPLFATALDAGNHEGRALDSFPGDGSSGDQRTVASDAGHEFVRNVTFEVVLHGSEAPALPHAILRPRVVVPEPWREHRNGDAQITSEAETLLARVRRRHPTPPIPAGTPWRMRNPQPSWYGETTFQGSWNPSGEANLRITKLPPLLAPRIEQIRRAIADTVELPYASPLPIVDGHRVEATDANTLRVTPLTGDGENWTTVHLGNDGTVLRHERHQYGVVDVTEFHWHDSPDGLRLVRREKYDRQHTHQRIVHEIHWTDEPRSSRPERIVLEVPGRLSRGYAFVFEYESTAAPRVP